MNTCATSMQTKDDCGWIADWIDPNNCQCPHDGYSSNDGCFKFTREVNGNCQYIIGKSLTAYKNKDHPIDGSEKAEPTWDIRPLCGWFGQDGADAPVWTIGPNGNWFVDGVDSGNPSHGADGQDGQDGVDGDPDGVVNGGSVVNGNVVLTRTEGLPNIEFPLCNQAWMLPKTSTGDGGAGSDAVNFVADSGGSWADVVSQYERYESTNNPIKKVILTEADLIAIGMRPTDNRVQVEMFSYVNIVVDKAISVGGQVAYNTTGIVNIYSPGGGSAGINSGANVNMGELDGGNDADRDSGTEWVTLGPDRDLCIVYEATYSRTPGGIVVDPANEPYLFGALNRRQWGKVRGFAAWDDGSFTARGGCESQGPN